MSLSEAAPEETPGPFLDGGTKVNAADSRKARIAVIVIAYPVALICVSVLINLFVFGIDPAVIGPPSKQIMGVWVFAVAALILNHSWLMTGTELTRLKFELHATPEEWSANERDPDKASKLGLQELDRHHNAHRNTTENVVYFGLVSAALMFITPGEIAAQSWIAGFAIGRIGHSFSYLTRQDGLRGFFMSLSLLSLYGGATYAIFGLMV